MLFVIQNMYIHNVVKEEIPLFRHFLKLYRLLVSIMDRPIVL